MTKWQIFALSSPVIVVAVMWLQGLVEGHFDKAPSDHDSVVGGSSGFLRGARAKAKHD
jgi:hypothetical protein